MPTVNLHPRPSTPSPKISNTLPQLLQTPSGLAILELQGTINLPSLQTSSPDEPTDTTSSSTNATTVGKLVFPDYRPQSPTFSEENTAWMKRVYLYVGKHQRLTGEVKKLAKPLAVVGKREGLAEGVEELEIRELVKWKVLFSTRPEPVSESG